MIHAVTFKRDEQTGLWRGTCTCGWTRAGERMEVQARAATHDIDQWATHDPSAGQVDIEPGAVNG